MMQLESAPMASIAYLCTDLLFTSKIRETAQALGHEAKLARDAAGLAAAAVGAALVIVDLRRPDAIAALEAVRAAPGSALTPAVGFVDHERTDLMADARNAGCTQVLAKGKFSSDLRHLIADAAAAQGAPAAADGER